jgi:protein-S-isoprenylcysteine O-methyltransferase Ste14
MATRSRLVLHSVVAVLVLPGPDAFAVPLLWIRPPLPPAGLAPSGLLVACAGAILLGWCVVTFFTSGHGTLAPWAPPESLVCVGPYRWSRNPMYVGVLLILAGWAIAFASPGLGVYAAAVAVAFHLRVRLAEEPWAERTFPDDWPSYAGRVPRWLGSVPGRRDENA